MGALLRYEKTNPFATSHTSLAFGKTIHKEKVYRSVSDRFQDVFNYLLWGIQDLQLLSSVLQARSTLTAS